MTRFERSLKRRQAKPARSRHLRLIRDVGCIPSGVYRLYSKEQGIYLLGLKKGIRIMLANPDERFIDAVDPDEAKALETSVEDFIERYYRLLHEAEVKPFSGFDPLSPFTTCSMPPELAREVH